MDKEVRISNIQKEKAKELKQWCKVTKCEECEFRTLTGSHCKINTPCIWEV